MAFIIKDRIKEGTTTTGTGDITLGGSPATFESFQSYMTNGDTTYYAIVHTASGVDEWEVGLGTWNTGNTLTRTTVLAGSSGTSAVNFSAGTKDIFMTYPAAHAALAGDDVTFDNITVTGTVDGRDVAADGTKLDTVEQNADVTDAVNVAAAGALMKSGGTMTGALILNADPTTALGAATKEYVDTIAAAGIHYHAPVRVEHPSNLNATYNNGSSGVGATLTNAGTNAALVLDNVSMVLNDRVLVANQTDQTQNGVYTVTTVGDGSTAWVLTRSTDTDSYAPSDGDSLGEGDAFFIKEGDTNAGHLDVMTTSGTITFGTTNIVFSEVAETSIYSAGTGLTLTGTTFSIGQDVGTTANVTFNQVTAAIIGNVTGNVTGDVSGNAGTATKLATARTVQLSGDVTGSASFDGSANINITAAVTDDSHAHVISNVDGLQTALDGKVPTSRTITAGNGLTGGGDLTANRTIDIDSSYTGFDGRYYTETEADSRFVNVTGDTMTGALTLSQDNTDVLNFTASSTNDNRGISFNSKTALTADSSDGYLRLNNASEFSNGVYTPGTMRADGGFNVNGSTVFHNGYHPNADKWTTARTLSLSGDASGSVSWDGSANATLSVTVADDSHNHTIANVDGLQTALDGKLSTSGKAADSNLLDGIDSASFVRSDASDTLTGGTYTLNSGTDQKIILQGASNPYIRWKEGTTDRFYIQWTSGNNSPLIRNQESSFFDFRGNNGVQIRLMDNAGTTRGSVHANTSNNVGFLDAGGSWAIRHINDQGTYFYTDGTTLEMRVGRDAISGQYGTVEVTTTKNGYAGYAINDDWVFMSNGAAVSGIYNDTNNEWAAVFRQNAEVELYYNGQIAMETVGANGIRVGSTTSSDIYMQDTDNGERRIHCNSNRLGFLDSSSQWSFYSVDGGDVYATKSLYVDSANDQKIILSGSSDPYIRFREGTTDRAYIQYNSTNNALRFHNQESDFFDFRPHDSTGAVNIRLRGSDDDTWGSIYADDNGNAAGRIGFLDDDGNWAYRHTSDVQHEWFVNTTIPLTLTSNTLTLDGGTSSTLNVKCDDAGLALIRANGDSQGTGAVEVGQSNSYGGGMSYNGDSSPAFVSGETSDAITFYRMSDGTRTEVFSYPYSSNTVTFNGDTYHPNIYLANAIYHQGDTNTYLQFEANDVFRIVIAGAELQEWGNNYTRLNDNDTLRLGNGSDFRMWHNGSHTYFRNYHHSAGNMYWQGENTSGTNHGLLYMYCDSSRTHLRLYENSSERLRTTSTGITVYGDVNSTSDIRYKKNVETIDNAVDKVKALRGVTFDWDNEAFEASGEEVEKPNFTHRATGVIAQDVEKVLPEAVREDADTGFKNVTYGNMVGLLIEAIKEQQEQIDMLTQKLNEMENK